jgi:hypothetical protein
VVGHHGGTMDLEQIPQILGLALVFSAWVGIIWAGSRQG